MVRVWADEAVIDALLAFRPDEMSRCIALRPITPEWPAGSVQLNSKQQRGNTECNGHCSFNQQSLFGRDGIQPVMSGKGCRL